jgi:hypothetical protein
MPDEKLARVLDVINLGEKWFSLLRTEARLRLKERPGCLSGWELRAGVTRATITGIREVWSRWEASWPGHQAEFVEAVTISKKNLEAAVRAVGGLEGRELKSALDALVAGCTVETTTSPRLLRTGEDDASE